MDREKHHVMIPWEFWQKYNEPGKNKLKRGWTDYLNKHFETINNTCVLTFKYHSLPKACGKNVNVFHTRAQCTHSECTEYHFTILKQDLIEFQEIKMYIERFGKIRHTDEIRRRFISGESRREIAVQLEKSPPSVLKFQMLGKVSDEILKAGNRNNAPSDILLRKISSENHQKKNLDKDFYIFLSKLKTQYADDPKYKGRIINGFIQEISANPFYVLIYTEKVLYYVIELSKNQYIRLLFDSTGTIINDVPDGQKRPYYYALLLEAETSRLGQFKPALPVLEFISTAHNVPYLTLVLSTIADKIRKITGNDSCVFRHIEMDFSMAEIQATLKAFNEMTVVQYLWFIWNKLKDNNLSSLQEKTIVHICSSHLIATVKRYVSHLTNDKNIQTYACYVITGIIHSINLETAAEIFKFAKVLFQTEQYDHNVAEAKDFFKKIKVSFEEIEKESVTIETTIKVDEVKELPMSHSQRNMSPYYQYFHQVSVGVDSNRTSKKELNVTNKENPFFCPQFPEYLLNEILSYFPLTSGIVIQIFGIRRSTNNGIENWFNFVKNIEFAHKIKILIPKFIQRHEECWLGRFKEVVHGLQTTRQMRKRQNNQSLETQFISDETNSSNTPFKKKVKEENHFFTIPNAIINSKCLTKTESPKLQAVCQNYKTNSFKPIECVEADSLTENSLNGFEKVANFESYKIEDHDPKSENRDDETNVARIQKPWKNFSGETWTIGNTNSVFDGMNIDRSSLQTLLPNVYIDDGVIDVFASILQNRYKDRNFLNFGIHNVQSLMRDNNSQLLKWIHAVKPQRFPVWILPLHDVQIYKTGHWTLFIVDISRKYITYINSMHGGPMIQWVQKIFALLNYTFGSEQSYAEWSIYAPTDIPMQGGVERSSGNCGPHMCVWYYILYSGENIIFSENDMNKVRQWLYVILTTTQSFENRRLNFVNKKRKRKTYSPLPENSANFIIHTTQPAGFSTTSEYCVSLNNFKR